MKASDISAGYLPFKDAKKSIISQIEERQNNSKVNLRTQHNYNNSIGGSNGFNKRHPNQQEVGGNVGLLSSRTSTRHLERNESAITREPRRIQHEVVGNVGLSSSQTSTRPPDRNESATVREPRRIQQEFGGNVGLSSSQTSTRPLDRNESATTREPRRIQHEVVGHVGLSSSQTSTRHLEKHESATAREPRRIQQDFGGNVGLSSSQTSTRHLEGNESATTREPRRIQHEVVGNVSLSSSQTSARHLDRNESATTREPRRIKNLTRYERRAPDDQTTASVEEVYHARSWSRQVPMTSQYVTTLKNNRSINEFVFVTKLPAAHEHRAPLYGVDTFLSTFHMFTGVHPSHIPRPIQLQTSAVCSSKLPDSPFKMVIAIDKAAETIAIVTRPSYQEKSVYSCLDYSDHRRHKEQVNFRPVLHPVRYSDTAFVYLNNTRKRFLSRTFYEPRVRPHSFADTTFNNPKTVEQHYVSYLGYHVDENRKWFKTCIEIKAKNFTSAQILRSQNNNYITTSANTTVSTSLPGGLLSDDGADLDSGSALTGGSFKETHDPGASQVFIPKRRDHPFSDQSLVSGELTLNFPNSKVDLNYNGIMDDFSEV